MLTAAAFLLVFTAGCLLAVFRHPIYGLSIYVGLVYIHPPTQWWGQLIPSLRWSLVVAAVTLLGVLIQRTSGTKSRLFGFGFMWGMVIFVCWVGLQSFWALNPQMHNELLVMLLKYTLLVALVYKCIESQAHLRIFLWTHAAGCFYLGTVVISDYLGGRFEGFSGPGINEANAAALLIVTGVITTFVLFLTGKVREKIVAVGFMPFTLNALVATISRSGFIALGVAGLVFNFFAPKHLVRVVRIFSVVGLVLLIMISNPLYWERIGTILIAGEDVTGVNTGSRRIVLIESQLEMFSDYPMGCGHRCTAVLSPSYLDDVFLTGKEGSRARSSHNTFMTLLVEQGLPGAIAYAILLLWIARTTFRLRGRMRDLTGLIPTTYAATVAILGAITVGDLFVDYLKFEVRFWFIGLLMVLSKMDENGELIKEHHPERIESDGALPQKR